MIKMDMKITRRIDVEGCGWKKSTTTTTTITDEYIRDSMGIDPCKPIDVIIGQFRQYLTGIDENNDEFGIVGAINPMTDFEIIRDQRCTSTYIVCYEAPRRRGVEFKWTIDVV